MDKNIVVFTNRLEEGNDKKLFRTASRIKEICEKRKIPYYILFVENCRFIKSDNGKYMIHNLNDEKGFEVTPQNTIAIIRGSVASKRTTLDLISQFEKNNIFCLNSRFTIEACNDKYRTSLILAQRDILTPKTAIIQDMDSLEYSLEIVDNKFPLIVKTISGSKGVGVFFVESLRSLKSILQVIWKINEDEELLIQQYIETPYDVRVHVLGDEVIAAMKRYVIKDDFRSNYSQGGEVKNFKVDKKLQEICITASKAVGAQWAGVDIITDKKGDHYVIEVNSSPGTEGIESVTDDDIIGKIIDFSLDDSNWIKTAKEIGYKEYVNILGKNVKAKFDTGNGSFCVLHADSIDIGKKNVKWEFDGKKYISDIEKVVDVKVGGMRDYKEKRAVIKLDVTFNNVIYKDVEFTLDNRSGRTPILINRTFMKKANILINPLKKYTLGL